MYWIKMNHKNWGWNLTIVYIGARSLIMNKDKDFRKCGKIERKQTHKVAKPCVAFNPVQTVQVGHGLVHELKNHCYKSKFHQRTPCDVGSVGYIRTCIIRRCFSVFGYPNGILRELGVDIPYIPIEAFRSRPIPKQLWGKCEDRMRNELPM